MRARTWMLCCFSLLLVPLTLRAAGIPACGEHDLMFGCTKTEEKGRLRAGCGVHDQQSYFASEWWLYDLRTEDVLKQAPAGPEGIALIEIPPKARWLILEGEMMCTNSSGEPTAVSYRFLVERTGKDSFVQRPYTPESLVATGNWNTDTQLRYGEFRSRSLLGVRRTASTAQTPGR